MDATATITDVPFTVAIPPEDRAASAWHAVSRAAVRIGGYASVSFDDPIVNAVMRSLGGWPHCCKMPMRVFRGKLRREFLVTYARFSVKGVTAMQGKPLWGLHDSENYRHGFHDFVMAPITIRVEAPTVAVQRRARRGAETGGDAGGNGDAWPRWR